MNRILIKSYALLLTGTTTSGCAPETERPQRPNILFSFSDDHATHAIGAYWPKHNSPELHKYDKASSLVRLADLKTDPDEMQNQYLNPEYSGVVKTMEGRLKKERIAVGDTVKFKATSTYHR